MYLSEQLQYQVAKSYMYAIIQKYKNHGTYKPTYDNIHHLFGAELDITSSQNAFGVAIGDVFKCRLNDLFLIGGAYVGGEAEVFGLMQAIWTAYENGSATRRSIEHLELILQAQVEALCPVVAHLERKRGLKRTGERFGRQLRGVRVELIGRPDNLAPVKERIAKRRSPLARKIVAERNADFRQDGELVPRVLADIGPLRQQIAGKRSGAAIRHRGRRHVALDRSFQVTGIRGEHRTLSAVFGIVEGTSEDGRFRTGGGKTGCLLAHAQVARLDARALAIVKPIAHLGEPTGIHIRIGHVVAKQNVCSRLSQHTGHPRIGAHRAGRHQRRQAASLRPPEQVFAANPQAIAHGRVIGAPEDASR